MTWLTRFSLRNRSVVALAVIAVVILGFIAVTSLRQELMPNINFPLLTVFTSQPGAAPSDVESGVTTPIENAIKGTAGLKELTSYSNEGLSIIVAQFQFGTNIKDTQATVQQAVQRLQAVLPPGAQAQVQAVNFNDLPVVQLAVDSSLPPQELAAVLQAKVIPQLQQIDGVAAVTLSGLQGVELQVTLLPQKLALYGATPQQVLSTLQAANGSTPVGSIQRDGMTFPVRITNTTQSIQALQRLPVQGQSLPTAGTSTPRLVTLGDVTTIATVPTPVTAVTHTNGVPTVGLAIGKTQNGNIVTISKEVERLLPTIKKQLGPGTRLTMVQDQAPYIEQSINSMWREGLLGALFAVLVILVFLRSWRSTIVAGLSIPLSVLIALIVLWGRGNSLNIITLGGLTIAIGRVIDDSIVVLENSYRHLQEGDDIETATLTATKEVSRAITASTITTVAVFLPLGFTHGIASEFFRPFALTVTFALLASLLVALTVVPVAVTWFLSKRSVGHREVHEETRLQRAYLPALRWAIGHKAITIAAAAAVFAASMMLLPLLRTNLLDSSAGTTIAMTQQMPAGTDLARTENAAAPIEAILKTTRGIDTYQVTVGSTGDLFGPGGGTNASSAQAQYTVVTDGLRDKQQIIDELRARIAKLRDVGEVAVSSGSDFGGTEPIEVRIYGEDPTALRGANLAVLAAVRTVPDLANISSNLSESRPEIAVAVRSDRAAAAGVDPSSLTQIVVLTLSGTSAGVLPTATGPLQMTLTLPSSSGDPLAMLRRLPIPTPTGAVPLGSVASITEANGPAQITHTDGQRTVTVQALPTSNNVGQSSSQIKAALDKAAMPPGTRWEIAGASEQMNEVFRSLGIAMLIAILLVYIIMVATFSSLLSPLILLVSIPFAAVGAVVLLFVTGTSLGMPSLIGLLMLIGIVVTNAIVLLDLIEQFRGRGLDPRTAVVEGARRRLRPILMTAVATILALIPMAVGPSLPKSWHLGESAFLSTPLAVVVIGGLFSSTVLTLILVPVIYLAVEPLRGRRRVPAEKTQAERPTAARGEPAEA